MARRTVTLSPTTPARRLAVLGGTTDAGDCLLALRYLARPDRLVQGDALAAYEQEFARRVEVEHAISFSHGRVGLYGLLLALGIGPGDEVLLQVPTHIVVPNAIRYAGATPVYVDCLPGTYNMDLEQAERRVTSRTRVLLLQHTFGIPADIDAASALARRHNLELIEDCVHALGATYAGRPAGSFGRAAFFSTEETKTISTTMGGMVTTADAGLAARMRRFQAECEPPSAVLTAGYLLKLVLYHLLTQPSLHRYTRIAYELAGKRNPLPGAMAAGEFHGGLPEGYARRLSNGQAALGLRQLRRLDGNIAHRRAIAALYAERLATAGITLSGVPAQAAPAYLRYPLWTPDRQAAQRAAAAHAVLGTWFTSVLEEAASPLHGGYQMGACPVAEDAARHLVNLPTHQRVRASDAEGLIAALTPVLSGKARATGAGHARPALAGGRAADSVRLTGPSGPLSHEVSH